MPCLPHSSGLRALVVLHAAAEEAGTHLAIRPSAAIDRLLRITHLDHAFPVLDAVPEQRTNQG
jgi:anti-anti-sigma regulatory factor